MSLSNSKGNGLEAQPLKEKYLPCFGVRTTSAKTLQEVLTGLIEQGALRKASVILQLLPSGMDI